MTKATETKKIVTHNGSFHSDDIFACATLCLMFEKDNQRFEIIRTRDEEIIKTGDYVFDVGGIYDEAADRFDHHQAGGAGRRVPNEAEGKTAIGIEYAAFGLVWKKFGAEVSGSKEAADIIERKLVAPIDAFDNGFDLVENKYNITPYYIQHIFGSMRPTWREELSKDEMFLQCVEIAKVVLKREIIQARDALLAEDLVVSIYHHTEDKRIIVLDKDYPSGYALHDFPEPLYVVAPRETDNFWSVRAVRQDPKSFANRKNFPASWGGKRGEELVQASGVEDAVFCHRGLFLAVAQTKEGAIKLAQIAVES